MHHLHFRWQMIARMMSSWALKKCHRENGSLLVEVERELKVHDTQDRDIVAGKSDIIYVYSRNFIYHGGRRPFKQIVLYKNKDDKKSNTGSLQPLLSHDIDDDFTVIARVVKKGMSIVTEKGVWEGVERVGHVWKRGLFNPHTLQDDIIVDGIVATTYSTAVERSRQVGMLLHALLARVRGGWKVVKLLEY